MNNKKQLEGCQLVAQYIGLGFQLPPVNRAG
jgi:hypothetical protein